jgi:ectoine hydroxylase-related dioxygenase (phytanoyl-CoA dioxygenase family)
VTLRDSVEQDGFCLVPRILEGTTVSRLIAAVEVANVARSTRKDATYGARNILEVPDVADVARSVAISSLVAGLIGTDAKPVRGIFFDKTAGANWPVAWHQDLTLALAERHDVDGWGSWSTKAGVAHVQPPVQILASMVTLRLHLDDCDADNGPLKVLPGTHKLGRIRPDQIQSQRSERAEEICLVPAGSALAMKPLLLHASSAARIPRHRRVIHIEFAPTDLLPAPLRWAFA